MKIFLKNIYWLLSSQFGIDPRRLFRSLRGIPRFILDWMIFRKSYKGKLKLFPCLYDWYEEGGDIKGEYFWQDLHVARKIYISNPNKHVDIGSRIDGFVAHVASFREVYVFDIRPITSDVPGIIFKQADLMSESGSLTNYCDSLSCLHALEHFGLGRYGDPINTQGYVAGLENMAKLLKLGGILYLSVPIGLERVEFNAHRIFDPESLVQLAKENGLLLKEFAWIEAGKTLNQSANFDQDISVLSKVQYSLGIFTFIKQ